jgi:hypothetical protein
MAWRYLDIQLSTESTRSALGLLQPLSGAATYALHREGAGREAAAAAERGRAVLLSRALALNTAATARLAQHDSRLAARLTVAARRVAAASAAGRPRTRTGLTEWPSAGGRGTHLH